MDVNWDLALTIGCGVAIGQLIILVVQYAAGVIGRR